MQPQALTRVSMRTLKDALHLFTGMPRLEADCVGAHGQGRSPSIFDRTPLPFINVILSGAKDLVYRHERTTYPSNEILRRGAEGAERSRSAPQNDVKWGLSLRQADDTARAKPRCSDQTPRTKNPYDEPFDLDTSEGFSPCG